MIATLIEPVALAAYSDREGWLRVRRGGVTATELRDIALGKKTAEAVAREKFVGESTAELWTKPIQWGNAREPVIAEYLRRTYGIEPSDVVYARGDNQRYLATPDGVGAGAMAGVISEIKTSSSDLTVGGRAFEQKGYGWQMDWQLYVMDAGECAFAWERRGDEWGGFDPRNGPATMHLGPTPDPIQVEWWPRDEARIRRLIGLADQVLGWLDALAEGREFDGAAPVDETIDTHAVNYLRGLEEEKLGKDLKERSMAAVTALMTPEQFVQVSPLARVSWPAKSFDEIPVTTVPKDDDLEPEVLAEVVRLRALAAKHQANAGRADAKLQALLRSHAVKETARVEVKRRPTIRPVKDKTTEEKKK